MSRKKPETVFKEKVRPLLEAIPKTVVEKIQQVGIRGTPDFLICCKGRHVAIELKVDDDDGTKLQEYKLSKYKKAGGLTYVMTPRNYKQIIKELEDL